MKPIVSVKDRAIDAFNTPFLQQSTQHAIRSFKDEINSDTDKSVIAKHPDDYDLYVVGEWDELTGHVATVAPTIIARGKDLVIPKGE